MPITDFSAIRTTALGEKLRVLSDENRIKIVLLLRDGERCVCDLVDSLGLPQSLVSHHLGVLRNAGFLNDRRSGKWVYYSLDREGMTSLAGLFLDLLDPAGISTAPAPDCDEERCC